jgi:hypothetical protein
MRNIVTPFLMFEGKAEEAINFYVSLIPDSQIIDIKRYGPDGLGVSDLLDRRSHLIEQRQHWASLVHVHTFHITFCDVPVDPHYTHRFSKLLSIGHISRAPR